MASRYERMLAATHPHRKRKTVETKHVQSESESESESEEENDDHVSQTFPQKRQMSVVRQAGDDLTCGMRTLQNLYGAHIVTREEMDQRARALEMCAYGGQMYDPQLGYYSVEVLQDILEHKGKTVQRIAIEKIPAAYYVLTLEQNPSFVGFIVSIDDGHAKHYVAVRYNSAQQRYRRVDSMPGVRPVDIPPECLFSRRPDGNIYCSTNNDKHPVAAVLAVGQGVFLEYKLMHDTWHGSPPGSDLYSGAIRRILQGNLRAVSARVQELDTALASHVKRWYDTWPLRVCNEKSSQTRRRNMPDDPCYDFLKTFLLECFVSEENIIVKRQCGPPSVDQNSSCSSVEQTAIRCSTVQALLRELTQMNWLRPGDDFWISHEDKRQIQDEYGEELNFESIGTFEDYGIDTSVPLVLCTDRNTQLASVGGFYAFQYKVEGTCIGQQHNAYSVRDQHGTVHVLYKSSIASIDTTGNDTCHGRSKTDT